MEGNWKTKPMITYGATRAGQFHDWVQDNYPDAFDEWEVDYSAFVDLDAFLRQGYWEILGEWYKSSDERRVMILYQLPWRVRFQKWLRWPIATWMNRYKDTCWTDLVLWSIGPELHPFSEIFHMRNTAGQCERMGDIPYCGKCASDKGIYEWPTS